MSRILVVGDLMLDEYVDGDVVRISPEAPVPILNCKSVSRSLGGAGNLVANLVGLGHIPYVLGVIGGDYNGGLVSGLLSELGVPFDFIKVEIGRETTNKTRFCSSGQHILRVDQEVTDRVDLFNEVEALGKFDYVISLIKEMHETGQPILVGTVSVEKSEYLSDRLKKENIKHNVLNAKHHESEAETIAQA